MPVGDALARTGFASYDRFVDALTSTREMPGRYPESLTAKDRKRALREVDGGNLRSAAVLTREACTEWGDVYGVLGSVTETLFGLPQKWQGPTELTDALRGTPDAPGLADVLIPETEAAAIMRAAIPFGVGLGRLAKVTIKGCPMRRLDAWDNEHLRYEWATDTWHVATNRGSEWRAIDDGEWVLFLPYGEKYPWKRAPWKALTLAYTLSRDAWFQRSRYGQVIAPTRVGTTSAGSSEDQRQAFAALLAAAQFDNWMLLRPEETYEVKGVSGGDRTADIFAQIIEWGRRTAITTIKGETVTTDGAKGFSSGDVQERMSSAKLAFYARAWSRFETEIFSWAAYDLTGHHARIARTYDTATAADTAIRIESLDRLGKALVSVDAGLKTVGLQGTHASVAALAKAAGLEVENIPASNAPTARIDFAPTDVAKMVTKNEGRASLGLAALPGEAGTAFIADEGVAQTAAPEPSQEAAA